MKSKFILPAFLCAICVSAADANVLGARELQQCEQVQRQLSQFAHDTTAATEESIFDAPKHRCLKVIQIEAYMAKEYTRVFVALVKRSIAATDRGARAAVNAKLSVAASSAENLLTWIREPINDSICNSDMLVVTTKKELLQVTGWFDYCVNSVMVQLSAVK